ncbi:MAG: aminotransferase class I/II-fold pyridoxal phosphate-dependent enzyme [Tumebacillaceae bacterium]
MFASTIPILHAILSHLRQNPTSFHVPGHKMGRGLPGEIGSWLGTAGRLDLTEIPGLDDLHAPESAIREAELLAAQAFGAEETYFLVNGSTAGNLAMIMAAIKPGEIILVPRNLHKSVLNGLIVAQAQPVFYHPDVDERFGIATGVAVETVQQAVRSHPQAKAVLITSPTYHGICSDLQRIADVVHEAGMMLLVDEAHGAHFAFHEAFPQTAMQAGADIAVQSTHKMLGSLTQSSMLHVQGARVDRVRLRKRLQLVQSTSPSYLLMASLDCARYQMQTEGHALLERALQAVAAETARLDAIPGLTRLTETCGYRVDPLKWTLGVTGLGLTGSEAYERLHDKRLTLELADPRNVLAVISYADTALQIGRLVDGLERLASETTEPFSANDTPPASATFPSPPPMRVPLHEAFQMDAEAVPLSEAVGRCAAEMVIPYPPGIPLIVPGEEWTHELVALVEQLRAAGVRFQGAEDSSLSAVQVLHKREQ